LKEAKSLTKKILPFREVKYGSNNIKTNNYNYLNTNILLVPHGLVGQWKTYLEKSSLKYFTIQKAKDIFELADTDCYFKGKKITMITKEDDITVRQDNLENNSNLPSEDEEEEEEEEEENINCQSEQKTITNKKSSVMSKSVNTNKPIKSSIKVLTVRKKTKADKEQSDKEDKNTEIEKKKELDEETNFKNDKKNLEKQKKALVLTRQKLLIKVNNLYKNNTRFNSQERFDADTQAVIINTDIQKIQKQINTINEKLKVFDLENGAIKVSEITTILNNLDTPNLLSPSLKTFLKNLSHLDKCKTEKYDVILLSSTFYNLFSIYLNQDKYNYNRLIIDECVTIKGNRMTETYPIFTWLITSSIQSMMTTTGYIKKPYNDPRYGGYIRYTRERVINSSGFIMNIIKEIYENKNENYKIYLVNNPEYIENSMKLPEMHTYVIICKDSVNIQVLKGVVSQDVMQMLNAGDIAGIVTKLDVAVVDENNIIETITRKYQDDLKVKEYELKVAIENPKYIPNCESQSIINKRLAIADLKRKISCIEERIKDVENCPICYDDFTNPCITPCCSNKFCFDCITMVLNSKSVCPMCKSELFVKNMIIIADKSKLAQKNNVIITTSSKPIENSYQANVNTLLNSSKDFSKYENMEKIFQLNIKQTKKKYLIFTEYENTLNDKLTKILDKYKLTYGRIRGSGIAISNMVNEFQKEHLNCLLINSKYFGSGLNLQSTTDIIIIHKMQTDIEMQVIGRAQRFGREDNLRVWKLYYENEQTQ
jgi:RNA polymerase subunit RPABC4/transcription elongation factor Spt4